jgi:hypothetical protein
MYVDSKHEPFSSSTILALSTANIADRFYSTVFGTLSGIIHNKTIWSIIVQRTWDINTFFPYQLHRCISKLWVAKNRDHHVQLRTSYNIVFIIVMKAILIFSMWKEILAGLIMIPLHWSLDLFEHHIKAIISIVARPISAKKSTERWILQIEKKRI